MPTKVDTPSALFLFAHQDDEFGVFAAIEQAVHAGRRVVCVYATDGAATADPERREAESLAVLARFGVARQDVLFIGRQLAIGDGQLHRRLDTLADGLTGFLNQHPRLEVCFVPAWEGGHPDHDLLHAVAVEVLARRAPALSVWQYPLYNGDHCRGVFFRPLTPLSENGPVQRTTIGWPARLRYLRLCLAYPSQWRTWIGLFPFVGLHYLCRGVQQLQPVDRLRLLQPPHARPLYYERRAFLDWPTLSAALACWKDRMTLDQAAHATAKDLVDDA